MISTRLRAAGVTTVSVLLLALVTPSAGAATRTADTVQKAYSTSGYKATVGPSASPKVAGYNVFSRTIGVQSSSGRTVARNVGSARLGPGRWKVTSTFKYRKKVAYPSTVTRTSTVSIGDVTDPTCVLTAVDDFWDGTWSVEADCTGRYGTRTARGAGAGFVVGAPVGTVGEVVTGDSPVIAALAQNDTRMAYSYPVKVTKYRWAYAKSRVHYRYVTVRKVPNPPTASYAEFRAIKAPFEGGHTLAQVRAIIGSNGTRTGFTDWGDHVFHSYEWRTASGGTLSVGFWDGRAYFKTWWG